MERKDKIIATFVILLFILLYSVTTCQAQDYYKLSSELGGRFIYGQDIVLKNNQSINIYFPIRENVQGWYVIKVVSDNNIEIIIDTLVTEANDFEYRFYEDKEFSVYLRTEKKTKISIVIHYYGEIKKE